MAWGWLRFDVLCGRHCHARVRGCFRGFQPGHRPFGIELCSPDSGSWLDVSRAVDKRFCTALDAFTLDDLAGAAWPGALVLRGGNGACGVCAQSRLDSWLDLALLGCSAPAQRSAHLS